MITMEWRKKRTSDTRFRKPSRLERTIITLGDLCSREMSKLEKNCALIIATSIEVSFYISLFVYKLIKSLDTFMCKHEKLAMHVHEEDGGCWFCYKLSREKTFVSP